jgi:CBS domain-containing protein
MVIETVDQIMIREVYKIDVSKPLQEAKQLFDKYHIRHLPVISKGKLIGMLSRTDIMRLSFGDTYGTDETDMDAALFNMLSVVDVMTHHPKVISPTDSIDKVASFLVKEEFHALPVSDNGDLVGIVTTTDIMKYQLHKLKSENIPEKYTEQRPWGYFEQFCQNTLCTVKIIHVNPHEELSLQYHNSRNEFWKVIGGQGIVVIDKKELTALPGIEFRILANTS